MILSCLQPFGAQYLNSIEKSILRVSEYIYTELLFSNYV